MLRYLTHYFTSFGVPGNSSKGYFQYDVISLLSVATCSASAYPGIGLDVLAVLEVEQCPVLRIGFHYDVATPSSVTSIRPAFVYKLFTTEMGGARAARTRATVDFYVIYKIGICHNINKKTRGANRNVATRVTNLLKKQQSLTESAVKIYYSVSIAEQS
jgi:hypothetical protein